MVLLIKIANIFSINDEVTLDLRTGSTTTKAARQLEGNTFSSGCHSMLKSVAIYGANAAGKSNVIKAVRTFVWMIISSGNFSTSDTLGVVPFKFGGRDKPSSFYIEFIIDGVKYDYSISVFQDCITNEKLVFYPKGRASLVFERRRKEDGTDDYKFSAHVRRPADVAQSTTGKNLFLTRAALMGRPVANDVYGFFRNNFILDYYHRPDATFAEAALSRDKAKLLEVLRAADCDISDITWRMEDGSASVDAFDRHTGGVVKMQVPSSRLVVTTFHRNNASVPFDLLSEESDGTIVLFNMMLSLLSVAEGNKIVLIDEIDQCLHPKLVEFIIGLFHKSSSAQLIFTTHDVNLLNLSLLRRDQIWFTEKDSGGATSLYSLFDFKNFRDNMNPRDAYLDGRFGAVPFVDDQISLSSL